MPARDSTHRLTADDLRLAGLLADTDLSSEELAAEFGLSASALTRRKTRVYARYGIRSRAGLRAAMLALELAPVGAR